MPNPLPKVLHDLAVVDQPPANQNDPRVPMAEQLALNSEIGIGLFRRANARIGWSSAPVITITAPRQINLQGIGQLPGYPSDLQINTSIVIPNLSSTAAVVRQDQHLSLVGLAVEVGSEHDATLNISFQYRNPQNTSQILSTTKENARRWRAFWLLVLSPGSLTTSDFLNALAIVDGDRRLTISDVSNAGFALTPYQLYARDSNWVAAKTYTIHPTYIDIAPICIVRRLQNYLDRGYNWGNNGEEALQVNYNILLTAKPANPTDLPTVLRKRLFDIFAGKPGIGAGYARTVQNLTSGSVPGNPGAAGEAAGALDGSVCLANDQRTGFSGEARVRKWSAQVVQAGNDGTGRAVVAVSLNTNSPIGTRFSENPADHKIYASNGTEQSGFGSFSSLGSNAALTWVATAGNTAITPGSTVYVVPGVVTPAGTGFSTPFVAVEKVWRNTSQLAAANVRMGGDDITAYTDPANSEDFIVVLGRERLALHYIYKKVSVTSDVNGVLAIPSNERGIFAFVQGVPGRIDAPVVTGLAPNTTVSALVYYPPRSLESWQFQFRYPEYQGVGLNDPTWLTGATVVSAPMLFAHTQGGGGSVFQGPEPIRFAPIAQHLPAIASGIQAHSLNSLCQLSGEASPGPGATFRELSLSLLLPAPGYALPAIGQVLTLTTGTVNQPRSLKGALAADGQTMGFRPPVLANSVSYQMVVAFVVEKAGERRLVIAVCNTVGAENAAIDSDQGTAFDVFRI